ncbi:MAG TPA: fumarylacetoacetate hydrolase family protein [Gammaproteobacteria bacterium]|nr:fumarylacetoacetate hydrolase family protein [Gammaproteobacteria bacterium]
MNKEKTALNIEAAADLIWRSAKQGKYYPEPLHGVLDFDDALKVQLAVLERRIADGETQVGWKIGLTSPSVRAHFNTESQPFGYLMQSGVYASGADIAIDAVKAGCGLEPELCWIMATDLKAPGATPETARKAVSGVCPGLEINEKRSGGIKDFGLAVADNLTQWGIVAAAPVSPVPDDFDSDALEVSMRRNGDIEATAVGKDVIDDHFVSLARLANVLGRYGRKIEAGQRIITGSFSKHEVKRGETWEAEFSGLGRCAIHFI